MPSRFLISAAHKSSGKTSVSIGLCAALARRGARVQPFKKGPDYIDPLWLGQASGHACHNLDFQVQSPNEIDALFRRHAAGADVVLVEGNKGLHDGLDVAGSDSNAALARQLGLPVVLVLDVRGTIRGVAPLLLGYRQFDPDVKIAGVILNFVGGPRHEGKLRAVIERYVDLPVFGTIQRDAALTIGERHLGLVPANEAAAAGTLIARLAEALEAQVDIDALLAASSAAPLSAPPPAPPGSAQAARPVRIGIARDRAFGFYYPGDLEALAAAGARLVPIDTLADRRLPPLDGLFIGGGFPETALDELEANRELRAALRAALAGGLPAYAECGGLMYLARSIRWGERRAEMVGAVPADVVMNARPVGRGYVRLVETGAGPWAAHSDGDTPGTFNAHEFHYSHLEGLPADARYAYRVLRGHGIDGTHDGLVAGNLLACYTHLRDVAGNHWAARFVDFVRRCAYAATPATGAVS
jgi:cobyrinic acid a,c-diamide synthase